MKDKSNQISHTADNDLTHSMVHYLLTIHKLKESKGYARVTDIANDLNLTKGSVSTAINNLKKKGLVVEEENRFLNLSKEGHDEVHKILTSRTLLFYFLKDFVGVQEDIAHRDSCLMEHLVSDETREKFFVFLKKLSCHCHEKDENIKSIINISSTIDLCKYDTLSDFEEYQTGDTYLEEN